MRRFIGVSLTVALALGAMGVVPVAAKGVSASATGSGHATVAGELRTFAFNAKVLADGSVSGQAEINNRNLDLRSHIVVDCLVVDGNRAWVGGVISDSTNAGLVGLQTTFLVIDNGEGAKAPADQITLYYYPYGPCTDLGVEAALLTVLFPIEQGNVQVH